MKLLKLSALLFVGLILGGCKPAEKVTPSGGGGGGGDSLKPDEVEVNMAPYLNSEAKDYKLRFHFGTELFEEDAKTFNKDLALLSFASCLTNYKQEEASKFFHRINVDTSLKYYLPEATEDTYGYTMAYKRYENYDLIAMSFRGFDYGAEWSNNLELGKTGNHNGFEARATEALTQLLFECHSFTPAPERIKIWLTGYSRGGALANMVAQKMMTLEHPVVSQEDMFVYTFEAPQGLDENNSGDYENIHNLVNSADLVTYVAPQEYGLYRCGNDIQLKNEETNVDRLINEFDKDVTLPAFTAEGEITTEEAYIQSLINKITSVGSKDTDALSSTRAEFADNYQPGLKYFIGLYFSLSSETSNKIKTRFDELDFMGKAAIMADGGIYNFLKPILDEDNVTYNDESLQTSCATLQKFLVNNPTILTSFMSNSNLTRIISMHSPEVTYVLLKNLEYSDLPY